MTGASEKEVVEALLELKTLLKGRGVQLMENGSEVLLATAPEMSELIENIRKEELTRDLGRAGAETLAIVLYQGASTRADIDYIRGVNSTFILRNLLIRGLLERISNPKDQRSFVYKPTFDLLAHLGVRTIEELPDYQAVRTELTSFVADTANVMDEHDDTESK